MAKPPGFRKQAGSARTAARRAISAALLTALCAAQQPIPRVPNFPLGLPAAGIAPWPQLDRSCQAAGMHGLKPCLASFVKFGSLPGAVLLVDRHDNLEALIAVGSARTDSIFQIQSMTKPFLAVAILMLIDEKKIPSIDTRVADLAGFQQFPYPSIRIRDLLTHTSGLWPVHQENGSFSGIAPHLTNHLDREPEVTTRDKTLEFVIGRYLDPKRYPLQPTNYTYSNIGYELLGWIVERLSGQPIADFLEQRIARPLGMRDTFVFTAGATAQQRARIADLDERRGGGDDFVPYDKLRTGWIYPAPAGALYSTAGDLRRFLRLLRYRGSLLSRESVELLRRDLVPGQDCGCRNKLGHTAGFNMIRTFEQRDCDELPGLGPGAVYHGGRLLTFFWYEPNRDEIGVYLMQRLTRRDFATTQSYLGECQAMLQMLARIQ